MSRIHIFEIISINAIIMNCVVASAVLMGTGLVNREWQNLTPHLLTDHQKFVTGDNVGDPHDCAKFDANPSTGRFWGDE